MADWVRPGPPSARQGPDPREWLQVGFALSRERASRSNLVTTKVSHPAGGQASCSPGQSWAVPVSAGWAVVDVDATQRAADVNACDVATAERQIT